MFNVILILENGEEKHIKNCFSIKSKQGTIVLSSDFKSDIMSSSYKIEQVKEIRLMKG